MARIRTIKPEFFTSEDVVSLSPLARLLYIALWCEADREGRFVYKPATFKLRYLPADTCDCLALCDELLLRGMVKLYGEGLAYIPAFSDHQSVNPRESASTLPEPDATPRVRTRRDPSNLDVHAQRGREGKGKEGKGTRVNAKTPLPADFAISERVQAWAAEKGHSQIPERFEHFCGQARAKAYTYADWDEAFMAAIRGDWAKLGTAPAANLPGGGRVNLGSRK